MSMNFPARQLTGGVSVNDRVIICLAATPNDGFSITGGESTMSHLSVRRRIKNPPTGGFISLCRPFIINRLRHFISKPHETSGLKRPDRIEPVWKLESEVQLEYVLGQKKVPTIISVRSRKPTIRKIAPIISRSFFNTGWVGFIRAS